MGCVVEAQMPDCTSEQVERTTPANGRALKFVSQVFKQD